MDIEKSIQQASAYAASSVGKRGTQTSYPERAAFLDWERKLKYKR